MKNRILLVCLPLLLASSLCYTVDDTQQIQQRMNFFKSAMKTFQRKMNFYARCVKGKCSQEEKDKAKAEMKKAAKIAIPTAIAITALVIGGTIIYKKYWPIPTLTEADKFINLIKDNNQSGFQKKIKKIADLTNKEKSGVVSLIVVLSRKNMLEQLLTEDSSVTNIRDGSKDKLPLLSYALWRREPEMAKLLLNQENIDVHAKVANISMAPLFLAAERKQIDLLKQILSHYSQEQVTNSLNQIDESTNFPNLILSPEEFEKTKNETIQTIKDTAKDIDLRVNE